MAPVVRGVGFAVLDPGAWGIEYRRLVHDSGRRALQPVIEPGKVRIARPEIAMVDEIVLVRADPQLLIADARLNVAKCRQHTGLEDVKPRCDVKAWDLDRAAEIVRRSKCVRRRVRDDFVEKRLPDREIRI